jgi:hypothetical protein
MQHPRHWLDENTGHVPRSRFGVGNIESEKWFVKPNAGVAFKSQDLIARQNTYTKVALHSLVLQTAKGGSFL